MLLNLHVKNLAIIDECEVDFRDGLNVLTGETGAGKSIIIDSINLALGAKLKKDILRQDAEYGFVELVFAVDNEDIISRLKEMEVFPEDGQVIISRRIYENRSVSKINGETVSLGQVRGVAQVLIDIHGQHEHQSLLYKKNHLDILDKYGRSRIEPIKSEIAELYKEYSSVQKEIFDANLSDDTKAREMDFLAFEINEIESAALRLGEDDELEEQYKKLSNGKRILEAVGKAHDLTGYDSAASAGYLIGHAIKELSYVAEYDPEISEMLSALEDADGILGDFNRSIAGYQSDNDFSDEEFANVESRLNLINGLKSKYGQTLDAVFAGLEERKEKLEKLKRFDEYIQEMEEKLERLGSRLSKLCSSLSNLRKEYAASLESEITDVLIDLNFLQVKFGIAFEELEDFTSDGTDSVEFIISVNPGEPMRPLANVASGGELSRIMLAIKTVLAKVDEIETLIFDEIDAGISGRTAQLVSEKMAVIAKNHQVICITHLPQIASMGDSHFLIEKDYKDNSTISTIRFLKGEESVMELARILGGARITDAVIENAREMKKLAEEIKS